MWPVYLLTYSSSSYMPPAAHPRPKALIPRLLLLAFITATSLTIESFPSRRVRGPMTAHLRFGEKSGKFKILQVADMYFTDGRITTCLDMLPNQLPFCSNLNTTVFIYRVIRVENPDLIIFNVDNIYGFESSDAVKSMNLAFAPAVALKLPWAAILGNHDQEGTLSREGVMQRIVRMPHTLSRLNPIGMEIDGFGNYNIKVGGAETSALVNKTILNLYFLNSSDYSTVPSIPSYGWIKLSQ